MRFLHPGRTPRRGWDHAAVHPARIARFAPRPRLGVQRKRELRLTRVRMCPLRPRGLDRPLAARACEARSVSVRPAHAHRALRRKVPTPLGRALRRGRGPTLPPPTEPLHRLQRTGTRVTAPALASRSSTRHPLPRRQPQTHEPSRADRRHPGPDEHDGAGHKDTFRGAPLDAPPCLLRQPGSAPSASRSGVY